MLTVVDLDPVRVKRKGLASEKWTLLDKGDAAPKQRHLYRCGDPCEAAAADDNVGAAHGARSPANDLPTMI
jgi:hypothetical protein